MNCTHLWECAAHIKGPEVRQLQAILIAQFSYNFNYHVILISLCIYHCIVCEIRNKLYYILTQYLFYILHICILSSKYISACGQILCISRMIYRQAMAYIEYDLLSMCFMQHLIRCCIRRYLWKILRFERLSKVKC